MDRFDHILNWTLKQGSHTFPGQDGGTCINEAAIVAAGFPFRPVRTVDDMPGCFSRPICRLAMQLNDEASDEERQLLLPFVTRLACADTAKVEREREMYITMPMRWRLPFHEGLTVLEGALAIGRQADVSAPDEVKARMEAVQTRATILLLSPTHRSVRRLKTGSVRQRLHLRVDPSTSESWRQGGLGAIMTAPWDERRMEVLTRLWLSGKTARMIAEKLGGGVTRNAVIGKAHRLGLTGKHGSKSAALKRARAFRPKGSDQQPQRKPTPKSRAH